RASARTAVAPSCSTARAIASRCIPTPINREPPMKNLIAATLLAVPIAAGAAEYLEKTPFQLSRAFSPGVVTDGGKMVWVAGQTATRDNAGNDIANNFEAQVKQVF